MEKKSNIRANALLQAQKVKCGSFCPSECRGETETSKGVDEAIRTDFPRG